VVRAFLAASATVPEPAKQRLAALQDGAVLRLCGYGRPDLTRAGTSDENRVVMYAESAIAHDNFHVYEVPVPAAFLEEEGRRWISVVLAFDPPVRHTRFDYLGVKMSFRLIRGKSLGEVTEAFRQRSRKESSVDALTSTKFDCQMEPSSTLREGGTLQKASFMMKRQPNPEYGDTYYLVVRCERKWARTEHAPQRYAAVVVVEHSASVRLYGEIRTRVQEAARMRARQRARQ
jgi:hypothetical protein